jgi:hypothetical protein
MSGIEHVLAGKADFVLRFRSNAFHLYDRNGQRLELLPLLRGLKAFENTSIECFYKLGTGDLRPLRLVAMKKDKKSRLA